MSKMLVKVGTIIAVAGVVATGIGAVALPASLGALSIGGVSVATMTAVGAGLSAIGSMTAKKPTTTNSGDQTEWQLDPDAAIPYAMGRTYSAGSIRHIDAYGDKRKYRSIVIVYSGGGPVQGFESYKADDAAVAFSGGEATGYYAGWMWLTTQLGQAPEASALAAPFPGFPGWSVSSKLSGYAAGLLTLKYDKDGKVYSSGTPKFGAVLDGVRVYDARQDGTYPGGEGPCRFGAESTYVGGAAAENPWCHALTYAIGRVQNGKLVIGVGQPLRAIDIAAYVAAANVADANGWKVGGVTWDDGEGAKWNNLKLICQAGGGEPTHVGARLSCKVSAPKVSIGTLTPDDLAEGKISIPAMLSRRARINGIVPKYRSEEHAWEMVDAKVVRVAAYVTEDKGQRTRGVEYKLVQDVDQASQLAAYDIVNAREFGPIVIPCKPRMWYYRPGDAITLHLPEQGLDGQLAVILNRKLNVGTGAVELTLASETTAKHAFALGLTGVAPPTPSLTDPEALDQAAFDGQVSEGSVQTAIATSFPIGLTITAADDGAITISDHVRRYTDGHADVAVAGSTIASGLAAGTFRAIGYDDPDRLGGAVAYALYSDDIDARVSPNHPGRHYVGYVTVPAAGSPPADGGGATPPGGSGCPVPDAPVLLASADRTGPGKTIRMGDLAAGMCVWSAHEHTGEWGAWRVTRVWRFRSALFEVADRPVTSPSHLWAVDPSTPLAGWQRMDAIGARASEGDVIGVTVEGAHTYVLVAEDGRWLLSHNKTATPDET